MHSAWVQRVGCNESTQGRPAPESVDAGKHSWESMLQYIEQFRIALSIFKVSAPRIRRDCPSMQASRRRSCNRRTRMCCMVVEERHPPGRAPGPARRMIKTRPSSRSTGCSSSPSAFLRSTLSSGSSRPQQLAPHAEWRKATPRRHSFTIGKV